MRGVSRLHPNSAAQGQGELFATYRYHAVFTDSPFLLVQAVAQGATIRAELIQVAARPARSGRRRAELLRSCSFMRISAPQPR